MKDIIIEDIVVNKDLIHLQNILFDLDNYSFDKDIIKILNELKCVVDNKLFKNFNVNGFDTISYDVIYRFKLKK